LSSLLAGLAGVLLSPLYAQLQSDNFTTLLVSAIAAAAFGSLGSIPGAFAGGVLLGVAQAVLIGYMPSGSVLSNGIMPAFPFVVLVAELVLLPGLRNMAQSEDPLSSCDPPPPPPAASVRDPRLDRVIRPAFRLLVVAFLVSSVTWLPGVWVFDLAEGLAFSAIFLSITVITGMSGQLSLCQATFAGVGAFTAAQLATHFGLSVIAGGLIGGALAAAVGALVALPTLRVTGLPVALVTLSLALLADNVVWPYSWAGGGASGAVLPRPVLGPVSFSSDRSFLLLAFVVLVVMVVAVLLVKKGTIGQYLSAIRGSEVAAAGMGINLKTTKVVAFSLSAMLAGLGGAIWGSLQHSITPIDFGYQFSLVYVVIVVTTGVRTVEGAIQAGMGYYVIQQLLSYLPYRYQGLEPVLFALGAMTYAAHPEGIVEYQKRLWFDRVQRLLDAWDARSGRDGRQGDGRQGDGRQGDGRQGDGRAGKRRRAAPAELPEAQHAR
jgi:ABC-type branched-subunit amino acid transport system permease subunit